MKQQSPFFIKIDDAFAEMLSAKGGYEANNYLVDKKKRSLFFKFFAAMEDEDIYPIIERRAGGDEVVLVQLASEFQKYLNN